MVQYEKRFAKALRISEGKILSIPLEKELHRIFTNKWRQVLPYGKSYSKQQILSAINKVYADTPQLLGEIRKWLRSNGIQ